jgi:hypothetical protein
MADWTFSKTKNAAFVKGHTDGISGRPANLKQVPVRFHGNYLQGFNKGGRIRKATSQLFRIAMWYQDPLCSCNNMNEAIRAMKMHEAGCGVYIRGINIPLIQKREKGIAVAEDTQLVDIIE